MNPVDATAPLGADALSRLFEDGRTFSQFHPGASPRAAIAEAVRLALLGPTEANSLPARFVVVDSAEGKERLGPLMSGGNRAKTLAAPAAVIVACDLAFPETLPRTFPHVDARSWYAGQDADARYRSALRSGALEAGYFLMALRALGLDAGPMAGFDAAGVDAAFLAGTSWRSFMIVNVGHGDRSSLRPRSPRLPVDEVLRFS